MVEKSVKIGESHSFSDTDIMGENKDIAVLVSGGLDSYVAYRKYKKEEEASGSKVIPLYVDVGQPYAEKERKTLREVFKTPTGVEKIVLVYASLCQHPVLRCAPTIDSPEIYGRNMLLAFYAAQLAPTVVLSALQTEMNETAVPDKRPEFFSGVSDVLTLVLENKWKGQRVRVGSPFASMTKTEVVHYALNELGIRPDELRGTTSCYHETHSSCGSCPTCYKRWIAFTNNGVGDNSDYATEPWLNGYAVALNKEASRALRGDVVNPRFSDKRLAEMETALQTVGIRLRDI